MSSAPLPSDDVVKNAAVVTTTFPLGNDVYYRKGLNADALKLVQWVFDNISQRKNLGPDHEWVSLMMHNVGVVATTDTGVLAELVANTLRSAYVSSGRAPAHSLEQILHFARELLLAESLRRASLQTDTVRHVVMGNAQEPHVWYFPEGLPEHIRALCATHVQARQPGGDPEESALDLYHALCESDAQMLRVFEGADQHLYPDGTTPVFLFFWDR